MSAFFLGLRDHIVNLPWKLAFLVTLLQLRLHSSPPNKIVVVSFYMANISKEVVAAQAAAIRRFLPADADLLQLHTGFSHGHSADLFFALAPYQLMILLDIDCIPIDAAAFPFLIAEAEAGALVGAAQRAHHIENGGHLYAGPFLMALTRATYRRLGRPSFEATRRGDVAEELTYAAETKNLPVVYLWPSSCEEPKWQLTKNLFFGRNTIYDNLFFHAFQIRMPEQQQAFVATIGRLLAPSPGPAEKASL